MEEFWQFCLQNGKAHQLEDLNWMDMSIGWFLAKEADLNTAFVLAGEARYTHQYWDRTI